MAPTWKNKHKLPLNFDPRDQNRPSSSPYISGDSFRNLSHFAVELGFEECTVSNLPLPSAQSVIFIKVDVLLVNKYFRSIIYWLQKYNFNAGKGPKIIIHNGDKNIPPRKLHALVRKGATVFCVNQLKSLQNVYAIPIGLENLHYLKNGVLTDFKEFQPLLNQSKNPAKRPIDVFASFNYQTNKVERKKLIKQLDKSRHNFYGSSLSKHDYLNKMKQSKFVLSPRGNGADCHRTWEAIYLGAIPVVKKNTLPRIFIDELPIWEVDNWDDVIKATNDQLEKKYIELIVKDSSKAFFEYWEKQIKKL